ncbi:hypothetical protein L2E82_20937 [Cichorium intybus]|uniref:Uncharacterized protein n=1 Tax=Cichorium intybus TaxID=13427 RepID=A0ACB9DVG3_CICIN|nr:hypothetical protein L2E82_20937 [Cichorium intybus]
MAAATASLITPPRYFVPPQPIQPPPGRSTTCLPLSDHSQSLPEEWRWIWIIGFSKARRTIMDLGSIRSHLLCIFHFDFSAITTERLRSELLNYALLNCLAVLLSLIPIVNSPFQTTINVDRHFHNCILTQPLYLHQI